MKLQIKHPISPMDALLVERIPQGEGWIYEPKWDGFRWEHVAVIKIYVTF